MSANTDTHREAGSVYLHNSLQPERLSVQTTSADVWWLKQERQQWWSCQPVLAAVKSVRHHIYNLQHNRGPDTNKVNVKQTLCLWSSTSFLLLLMKLFNDSQLYSTLIFILPTVRFISLQGGSHTLKNPSMGRSPLGVKNPGLGIKWNSLMNPKESRALHFKLVTWPEHTQTVRAVITQISSG